MARYQGSLKPPFSFTDFHTPGKGCDFKALKQAEQQWVDKIKTDLRSKVKGDLVGEEIQFPRGDGYARYLIASEKPFTLVHLEIGDAWHADPATIRGFRLQDARAQVMADRRTKVLREVERKASQKFYEEYLDTMVHYHDGFGKFVRCVVVQVTEDAVVDRISVKSGEFYLKQRVLVGKWGELELKFDSYHMRGCREGRLFRPHLGNVYEFSKELQTRGTDPRNMEPCQVSGQQELSFT